MVTATSLHGVIHLVAIMQRMR